MSLKLRYYSPIVSLARLKKRNAILNCKFCVVHNFSPFLNFYGRMCPIRTVPHASNARMLPLHHTLVMVRREVVETPSSGSKPDTLTVMLTPNISSDS